MFGRKFHFTFCTADINDPNDKEKKASAYAVKDTKSTAFGDAGFLPYEKDEKSGLYNGFTMTYTSNENDPECTEQKKSTVKFFVKCNHDKKDAPAFT